MISAENGRIERFYIPKTLLGLALNDRRSATDTLVASSGETTTECPPVDRLAGSRWPARVDAGRPARKPVILVAMDDSPASTLAADWATEMARKMNASVLLVHAIYLDLTSYGPANPTWLKAGLRKEAMERAEPLMTHAQASDVLVTCAVEEGAPASVITRAARRWQAQIIVMAAPRPGFFKRLFGSRIVEKVVRDAECPVIILESARCS